MFNKAEIYIDCLTKSDLFRGLSPFEIEDFLESAEFDILEADAGKEIQIDIDRTVFVLSGSLAAYNNRSDGTKNLTEIFEPDGSALIAVSLSRPYPFENMTVTARKKSVVLMLETKAFLKPDPQRIVIQNTVQQNIIGMFYRAAELNNRRICINAEPFASARIREYLKSLRRSQGSETVYIPLSRSELAGHLNIDVSTLRRELNKLIDAGAIEIKGRRATILSGLE